MAERDEKPVILRKKHTLSGEPSLKKGEQKHDHNPWVQNRGKVEKFKDVF